MNVWIYYECMNIFRCNVTIFKAILFFIFALFSIKKLLNFTFLVTIFINAILYFIFALFIINKLLNLMYFSHIKIDISCDLKNRPRVWHLFTPSQHRNGNIYLLVPCYGDIYLLVPCYGNIYLLVPCYDDIYLLFHAISCKQNGMYLAYTKKSRFSMKKVN